MRTNISTIDTPTSAEIPFLNELLSLFSLLPVPVLFPFSLLPSLAVVSFGEILGGDEEISIVEFILGEGDGSDWILDVLGLEEEESDDISSFLDIDVGEVCDVFVVEDNNDVGDDDDGMLGTELDDSSSMESEGLFEDVSIFNVEGDSDDRVLGVELGVELGDSSSIDLEELVGGLFKIVDIEGDNDDSRLGEELFEGLDCLGILLGEVEDDVVGDMLLPKYDGGELGNATVLDSDGDELVIVVALSEILKFTLGDVRLSPILSFG